MNGVIDVFVNQDITFQVSKQTKVDAATVEKLLRNEGVKVQKIEPTKNYVL